MNNILFVISHLNGGGAEHVARKNIECILTEEDYKVSLLTCDRKWKSEYGVRKYIAKDCLKDKSPLSIIYSSSNYRVINECLKEVQPNIIHIHDFIVFSPALYKALVKYKNKHDCKIIMTHHTYNRLCTNDALYNYSKNQVCEKCIGKFDATIISDCCAGNKISSIGKYIQKKIFTHYWDNLMNADISPSEFLMNKLISNGKTNNGKVVYNPCIESIENVTLEDRDNSIVFFGRVSKEKNIVEFAKMFLKVNSELKLIVIGRGNCEVELLEVTKASDKIEFICDFLDTESLYKIIKKSRYFILPSVWYENSPVSIVEAINVGLIPIVSNIGGMQELIDYFGVGYTFSPTNLDEIEKIIDSLEENYCRDINRLKIARGKLDVFLVEHYKQEILNIYKE